MNVIGVNNVIINASRRQDADAPPTKHGCFSEADEREYHIVIKKIDNNWKV